MFNRQVSGLIRWLAVSLLASLIGALASIDAKTFYAQLMQPDWAPPAWVFGPVWTTLYAMMGVAAWLVWRRGGFSVQRKALVLFLVQLAVNALWSWLFFGWHLGAVSFFTIVILWLLIVATILQFRHASLAGALLLVPYLLWVSMASALCYQIWSLNPEILG